MRKLLLVCALAANLRWDFLVTNLQVFPGTENFFQPDSKLFWRLRPNLRGVRAAERLSGGEYPFSVSTDAHGRRVVPQAGQGRDTLLFLGDSCTFGIPVNDDEAFPAVVQKRLPSVACVNAGVPGYSAFQGHLLLEELVSSPAPRAVVITFWTNDRSPWDHLSDPEHAELLAADAAGEFSRHRLTRLLRRATAPKRPRLTSDEFAAEIRAIVRRARDWGAKPILLAWPSRAQMAEVVKIEHQEMLLRVAREQNVPALDLVPVFRARGGISLFVDGIHGTRQGYAVAAEAILPLLQ